MVGYDYRKNQHVYFVSKDMITLWNEPSYSLDFVDECMAEIADPMIELVRSISEDEFEHEYVKENCSKCCEEVCICNLPDKLRLVHCTHYWKYVGNENTGFVFDNHPVCYCKKCGLVRVKLDEESY